MSAVSSMTQVYVCGVEDVPVGEGLRVESDELPEPVAVFNDEGRFYALSDTCSHATASLAEGEVKDCQVECPLHWARFDLETGRARSLPALLPVRAYPVTVLDGRVYVTVPGGGAS
ncbi:bifunctional 3-phenylpropionate/cinnamic acid dioxygenase ferredoxin subunit [Geodermatophilus ruber]|uniref:Ferredoxin subunit of nitrite reductase or a ring-hydroxylating dioxygenase n=1 Tax=Geodermatophilus ruber TaxID=504800 RepID=A0A1I4GN52_9ACTN|nr:bifunctional 3-phenylpropionate/cinnamic acid dioxygenase ferredoxin subunit [Geodermatophilus ruber]SFL30910.1 Ferredoxin subunit of nitrite reductase or a ring-hydroxylating dioxygenase [Geodermatophilus ruber]